MHKYPSFMNDLLLLSNIIDGRRTVNKDLFLFFFIHLPSKAYAAVILHNTNCDRGDIQAMESTLGLVISLEK